MLNQLVVVISIALCLCSCGAVSDVPGIVYMGHTKPLAITDNPVGTKVGTVRVTNFCNLVTIGNGSINRAAKMAGIKKISHVDVKTTSVLMFFYVYGE